MQHGDTAAVPHRKTIRHFDLPGHAHELTFSTSGRRPLLVRDDCCSVLGGAVTAACARHRFDLLAFVFMPEHVHLIVHGRAAEGGAASLLQAIKRTASFRIHQLKRVWPACLPDDLFVVRHDRVAFQFWQSGPGYDRNITNPATLNSMIEYLHANPVRRGLCRRPEDWLWSSAGQFAPGFDPTALCDGVPRVTRTDT